MIWIIIAFFVIAFVKYFSYDEKEDMKGYKAFMFSLISIIGVFIGYVTFIGVGSIIVDMFKEGEMMSLLCFLFGGFIVLFPTLASLCKAFENDNSDDDEED